MLKNKIHMAFTNSFGLIVALIVLVLANLFWFFLLPAKGENHPSSQLVYEIERIIRRAEDTDAGNWSSLKRQIKTQKMDLTLNSREQAFSAEQSRIIHKLLDILTYFVEGNWLLYEVGEDADMVKKSFLKAQKGLREINQENLNMNIIFDKENKNSISINITQSVSELTNLVNDKIQYLEETYGV